MKPRTLPCFLTFLLALTLAVAESAGTGCGPGRHLSRAAGEPLSGDYEVTADGQKVDVYTARVLDPPFAGKEWDFGGPYSFANFDMAGRVTVRIKSTRSLRNTVIRPQAAVASVTVEDDHTLVLTLDGPRKFSVEPDGKKGPLLLFANPLEENPPQPDAPNVIYFGPGIHQAGQDHRRRATRRCTWPAARWSKAASLAQGDNIRIAGRGILDGSDWEWRKGPDAARRSRIQGSNVEVSGITIRGSSHWTIVPRNSRHVTVRDVKLCDSRVQNDDGINPCNSQDVLITDCFIRSDDDCVALKGLDLNRRRTATSSGSRSRTRVLWCDRARIFLLGHESRAAFMRRRHAAQPRHHPLHHDAVPVRTGRGHAAGGRHASRTCVCTAKASASSSA